MDQSQIRNIAIIAHVDHGKTTLVDQLFKQTGSFRNNQVVQERLMDSLDLEKERGITISAKNGSFRYEGFHVNIIDTPGHADFGGQVERILNMVDGAVLLVDASEGPMPQTYYVLKKALALQLPIIVCINKIDKKDARPAWVVERVIDLFIKLNAPDHCLDFPVVYSSARDGWATDDFTVKTDNLTALYKKIIEYIPQPKGDPNGPIQFLVSTLTNSQFLGRLAIGKLCSGSIKVNCPAVVATPDSIGSTVRISKIYKFETNKMVEAESASAGEIVAIAGIEDISIGQTITSVDNPKPLPYMELDQPTISMNFLPNDSPFAGTEGKYVTSRHIRERLLKETLNDVALKVQELTTTVGYKVSGRGELHLSILIETMRREGYEFQVSRPEVIMKKEGDTVLEPFEELTVDVAEEYSGAIIKRLNERKGLLLEVFQEDGMARIVYKIPTRGLLGFRSEFMTETRGMGVMNYVFMEYDKFCGEIKHRINGAMVSTENCVSVAYALFNLQSRGKFFLGPQEKIYEGQVIGEHSRDNDLYVNPGKGKKLTNMRASGSDENVILTPVTKLSLENCIEFINDDELVEVTPKSIRLRKFYLKESDRKKAENTAKRS
ncbi:MAG: GTP-binding protein TypA [Spirochaetes bacterium GWF1_31_7]|nr:MAG: GTP-binding protein TypA [Spirochaetes bacterium GWE1_32_154]OHD47766.1 MAG: GTP-binding protein TypA [Spirochaetes bacterium GWF1_31_7]OHD81226.1 MAG: GTP-binding protein TypA [Spirochaetes bacterium RIFOXYB1_FULL_32_8]HBD95619.1 translational GTPase TypA [Spirochaetia bacterium]HBI37468.1 translational GTPase TypA [Spirochaetia bacterium]